MFGPRQDPGSPYSGVISLFIRALLDGKGADHSRRRRADTRLHLRANVVDGVLRAAETPGMSHEIMNVATGTRVSLNALLASLQAILGTNVTPIYGPSRHGDVRDSQADISKAERLIGYRPIVQFEEGLRRTVDWYRKDLR